MTEKHEDSWSSLNIMRLLLTGNYSENIILLPVCLFVYLLVCPASYSIVRLSVCIFQFLCDHFGLYAHLSMKRGGRILKKDIYFIFSISRSGIQLSNIL